MRRAVAILSLTCALAFLSEAQAEPRALTWDALPDPEAMAYENPFSTLTTDQLSDLSTVLRLRERLDDETLSDTARPRIEARLTETQDRLGQSGVDADWILSQRDVVIARRDRAELLGNPSLDRQEVTLSGFLVPAPDAPDGTAIAYLVPQFGMCSHYPPPPPNQLIRLRISDEVLEAGLHVAATVTGTLRLEETDTEFVVVDGPVRMWSSWTLEVGEVLPWDGFTILN